MKLWAGKRAKDTEQPKIRVHLEEGPGAPADWSFTEPFRIGREMDCEVRIEAGQVSRIHAEVTLDGGTWWIRDLGSTNGVYVDGEKTARAPLRGETILRLGRDGPSVRISLEQRSDAPSAEATSRARSVQERTPATYEQSDAEERPDDTDLVPAARPVMPGPGGSSRRLEPSLEAYIQKYFDSDEDAAGDHTRMIRRAYAEVHKQHERKYVRIFAVLGALLAIVGGYAIIQELRIDRFERLAAEAFYSMKATDAQLAKLTIAVEETNDTSLSEYLDGLEQSSRESRATYEVYVEELGVRRKLTPEEQVIYRMANIFNESETEIPADFIREVREGIQFWQTQGRVDLSRAVERANQEGYTEHIVRTMQQYGLPPQFFYLALQESKFDVEAVGTPTRFGYAKGMWQFIPETAERYGLHIGGLAEYGQFDAQDERHDFERSTEAAARYLRDIYGKLAQASALLAMASYNWGEGRVVPKLEELLEDIPDDPRARSYWRFYEEYSSRMPDETKDYVRKIFAAAVIGEDPRLFGFDFDNPLANYIEGGSSARP